MDSIHLMREMKEIYNSNISKAQESSQGRGNTFNHTPL